MNTDKAYILGLVIGGGGFSSDNRSFFIRLPYRQWGEADKNPERAGKIAKDILRVVKPLMSIEYGLDVSYVSGREWRIECHGDTKALISDLLSFSIEPTSALHKTADISNLVTQLSDNNMKKRFIAGVADTIGSLTPSQRRFSEDVQIISFEISGFNYKFVCQLCNLLYDVGCFPDQILWQHPNMQSGSDSYYKQWKKGNKLRVALDTFSSFGSLAFASKAEASRQNLLREPAGRYNAAIECINKTLGDPGVVAVHMDEDSSAIPEAIRGGHYIHHKQLCAVLNCPHAPCNELDRLLSEAEKHVSPFTVLHKNSAMAIGKIIDNEPILSQRHYSQHSVKIADLVKAAERGMKTVLFANGALDYRKSTRIGYPINEVLNAIAYIIASQTGNLNGRRPKGAREKIIADAISSDPLISVKILVPDLLTPIIITNDSVSALVGPLNADVYRRLISRSPDNKYKMFVRKITETDLRE